MVHKFFMQRDTWTQLLAEPNHRGCKPAQLYAGAKPG